MDVNMHWTSENEFVLDGTSYVCSGLPTGDRSTAEQFRIIKARWSVERYEQLIRAMEPKNILELGIYDGGSTAFITQFAQPNKLVAVDLTPDPCAALETFLDARDRRSAVATYYGVNQADTSTLAEILDREFGDEPLDLVIDDASHLVDETRRSFNFLFPRLKPGGVYLIEDWSWAHNVIPPRPSRRRLTPLSVLILELMLVCAHHPNAIEEIVIKKGWALLYRGSEAIASDVFDISTRYGEVGQELMSHLTDASTSWGQGS